MGDGESMIQEPTKMKLIPFLTKEKTRFIRQQFGTPVFVYDQRTLQQQAGLVLDFPNAFGLTVRFAVKACPTSAVLKVLTDAGLHFDASSGYEVERALRAGVSPGRKPALSYPGRTSRGNV